MRKDIDVWKYVEEQQLSATPLFERISEEGIHTILQCSNAYILHCKKGEYLFREGDAPKNLYLLISGKILILKEYIQGRRNVFFEVHEGEILGILINHKENEKYWYDTLCTTASIVLCIPWSYIFDFCSNVCIHHQILLRNMVSVQADSCVYQMKKLHVLSGVTLEAKIALLMVELADDEGVVDFKMNREELADYLGVSRPSLSRSLMEMKKQGIIEIRKSYGKILNYVALEKLWQK